jgi:1,4-dihydroxy-2-naphthoate polyprenyltransferase
MSLSTWLEAARPRTLPLALAVTGFGNFIVFEEKCFKGEIVLLSLLTTLFLQVLSNFANDYGDARHGADHAERKGPKRAVQMGKIPAKTMFGAIQMLALCSLVSGITLLAVAFWDDPTAALPLFGFGLLAIGAAYYYTNGPKPYGYMALGDISVFTFFGFLAVFGTAYLHTHTLYNHFLLPACAMGFWSTAVLHINNMRDVESDKSAGKNTLAITLGTQGSRIYHSVLVLGGIFTFLIYSWHQYGMGTAFAAPGLLLIIRSFWGVLNTTEPADLDRFLKPQALGTFLAVAGMWASRFFLTTFGI